MSGSFAQPLQPAGVTNGGMNTEAKKGGAQGLRGSPGVAGILGSPSAAGIFAIDGLLLLLCICGSRLSFRLMHAWVMRRRQVQGARVYVAKVGHC